MTYTVHLPFVAKPGPLPNPKLGLAWNKTGRNDVRPFRFSAYHNWDIGLDGLQVQGLERIQNFSSDFRPYGTDEITCQINLYHRLISLGAGYSGTILFLNEPDLKGQADKSPSQAVNIFFRASLLCPNARWTLPQVSHIDFLNGWPWMRGYLTELSKYRFAAKIVYGAFHSYIPQIDEMVASYGDLLVGFGFDRLPILLTEWGTPDPGEVATMYLQVMNNPQIHLGFWFTSWVEGGGTTNLFTSTGDDAELTAVGERLLRETKAY